MQLEVLDTAGAEQFTSLNEVYIKVATSFNTIRRSSDNSRQSGRGFVLVFRSKFLPIVEFVLSESPSYSLTQEASLQEVDNLRNQIIRVKGADVVRRNSSPQDVAYICTENPNRCCWNKARPCQRTRGP